MLIQIADKPEEVPFYLRRIERSWAELTTIVAFGRFVIPFFVLLPRISKHRPGLVAAVGALTVVCHYLNVFWLVGPAVESARPAAAWLHVSALVGLGGAVTAFAAWRLRGRMVLPVGDPALAEALTLLALFVTWWVIGFRQYVAMRAPPESTFDVYVSGKQWMWTFAYPDGSASNGVLVVPANRPVKLIMTSRDVIHSFFVPEFRLKQDVVPGRVTTLWFEATVPGRYQILCAEYCGTSHSTMRGEVLALSGPEFERYIELTGFLAALHYSRRRHLDLPVALALPGGPRAEVGRICWRSWGSSRSRRRASGSRRCRSGGSR